MIERPGRSGREKGGDARMDALENPQIDLELASRERRVKGLWRRQRDRASVHRLRRIHALLEELEHAVEISGPIDPDFKLAIHDIQLMSS